VAYLATRLHAAQPGTYALLAGGDDALQLWVDGQLVHRDEADGPFFDHLRLLPVTLTAGPHTVLARLTQQTGYWQLHLEPRAADGAPTPHLTGLPPRP
jgi:hypothetical protein